MDSAFTQTMLSNLSYSKPRMYLEEKLEGAPQDAIDLIRKLIAFNPTERPTAEQCLEHPYVAQFHYPAKEIAATEKVTMVLEDSEKHTIRDYRNQIYREAVTPTDSGKRRSRPASKTKNHPTSVH